jgi:hypothetical protein
MEGIISMKKYEVNRMAVLIDVMAECMGCDTPQILAGLQISVISEQEASEIKVVLDEMEE